MAVVLVLVVVVAEVSGRIRRFGMRQWVTSSTWLAFIGLLSCNLSTLHISICHMLISTSFKSMIYSIRQLLRNPSVHSS